MEKKELLLTLPHKRVYATEDALIHCEEFLGDYADIRNTMHCFLMQGLADQEVTCNFLGKVSETEHACLKVLERRGNSLLCLLSPQGGQGSARSP